MAAHLHLRGGKLVVQAVQLLAVLHCSTVRVLHSGKFRLHEALLQRLQLQLQINNGRGVVHNIRRNNCRECARIRCLTVDVGQPLRKSCDGPE